MFGKPGRPREDVFRRRLEIYTAVAPLLEKVGARGLTMRQAAAAAHMSVGGIYHYFPAKRDLVLFVLSPDALQRLCEQPQLLAPLERTDPHAHLATFVEGLVRGVPLLRPAVLAAIELGAGPALDFAEATMTVKVPEFVRAVKAVRPDIGDAEARTIDRAVRHTTLGAMLDRNVTPSELRNELYFIVQMRPRPAREMTGAKLQPASRPEPHQLSHRSLLPGAHAGPAANGKTMPDQREGTGARDFPGCVLT